MTDRRARPGPRPAPADDLILHHPRNSHAITETPPTTSNLKTVPAPSPGTIRRQPSPRAPTPSRAFRSWPADTSPDTRRCWGAGMAGLEQPRRQHQPVGAGTVIAASRLARPAPVLSQTPSARRAGGVNQQTRPAFVKQRAHVQPGRCAQPDANHLATVCLASAPPIARWPRRRRTGLRRPRRGRVGAAPRHG